MINDEWLIVNDEWLIVNDEWLMINDEWLTMNDESFTSYRLQMYIFFATNFNGIAAGQQTSFFTIERVIF